MLKFGSKSDVTVVHRATIRLFDDNEIIYCDFQPQDKGRYILEYVCKQLNILEMDYFGLRYVDKERERHWLDLAKTAIKQVKDMHEILLCFRVKFYPPDPLRLKEEITRYQVYQQLKRDLLYGRLCCTPGEAALLVACIVQSELGDYDPEIHEENYISEHKLLKTQTPTIEEKAMEIHQGQLKGFTPEQAENYFLRIASQLDTYAVDPHPVKDPDKSTQLHLGINHCGILTFQDSRKIQHFRWSEVQKINFEGKMFIVHVTINEDVRTKKKHLVGFKCPTATNCRHVWRCAIEQMLFFTLPRASDAPVVSGGSIFSWGYKFKYTGRTEREVLEEVGPLRKEEPPIQRCQTTCLRRKASSVPATPSTPSQDLVEIPVDENDTHASATHTSTTTITTTTTTTTTTSNTIITNRAKAKLKFPKSTLNRPQPLYSQKIVIGSEELAGRDIEHVVRQRINALINERSPKVVRSTALIIKSSKAPASANGRIPIKKSPARDDKNTRVEVSELDGRGSTLTTTTKTANGCANLAVRSVLSNGFDRQKAGVGQHEGEANDYYFRDSFDHSSSESQLLDASGKPHSRSVTPVPKMQKLQNSKLCLQQQQHQHQQQHQGVRRVASGKLRHKSLHVIRLFIPAFMLTITVLFIVTVLVFETDTTLFNSLRKTPEMVALRSQYYVPIKEFLRTKLGLF
ncbi:FERM domain-containing protein 5 isoform X3 [Camponotus floridanus]|uniref:FERM domain-containing protein 5 isoform X3 n=1 Tax=Camponotus floridanus TaxID=104421 RepID=UPI00059E4984|nr:FERM domain-containing protein 5 isoform X3 [Camponotus floridanus]